MFPITRFRIKDRSMEPAFREGDYVLACKYLFSKPKVNDVVVARHDGVLIIKRVISADSNKYILRGDNSRYSSAVKVKRWDVIGKVVFRTNAKA